MSDQPANSPLPTRQLPPLTWYQKLLLRFYDFLSSISLFHVVFAITFAILISFLLFYFASSNQSVGSTFLLTFIILLVVGFFLLQIRQLALFKRYLFEKQPVSNPAEQPEAHPTDQS